MSVVATYRTLGGAESQVQETAVRGVYVMPCTGCGSRQDTTDVPVECAEAVARRAAEYHATYCEAFVPGIAEGFVGPFYGLLVSEANDGEDLIAFGPNLTERRALAAFSAFKRWADPDTHRELRADLRDHLGPTLQIVPTRFFRIDPDANEGSMWRAVRAENSLPAVWLTRFP